MLMTLKELRLRVARLLEFGVDDTLRNDAGFFMAGGVSNQHRDREASLVNAPPGLGDDQEPEDNDDYTEQEPSQPGARASKRAGRQSGSIGT
jgi:hypothetical protein